MQFNFSTADTIMIMYFLNTPGLHILITLIKLINTQKPIVTDVGQNWTNSIISTD